MMTRRKFLGQGTLLGALGLLGMSVATAEAAGRRQNFGQLLQPRRVARRGRRQGGNNNGGNNNGGNNNGGNNNGGNNNGGGSQSQNRVSGSKRRRRRQPQTVHTVNHVQVGSPFCPQDVLDSGQSCVLDIVE